MQEMSRIRIRFTLRHGQPQVPPPSITRPHSGLPHSEPANSFAGGLRSALHHRPRYLLLASLLLACAAPSATPLPPAPTATAAPAPVTVFPTSTPPPTSTPQPTATPTATFTPMPTATPTPHPLTIRLGREREYPGSDIKIEQTLASGGNYNRYVTSYLSDGLKINALLMVPSGSAPKTGWPVVIFNHGFIPPRDYRTTERYVAYVDAFARAGYIVLKSDYRGHGDSEGNPSGGYGSPGYTIDVLNAVGSIKRFKDADPNRIGMWGHSMGGFITLRSMVLTKDIKAGVVWGGVVASHEDLVTNWFRRQPGTPVAMRGFGRFGLFESPQAAPEQWRVISANSYLPDISGPIQQHHSVTDEEVPVMFAETLHKQLQAVSKPSELFTYPGDNHNISANFGAAMFRSVQFMDKYVKNVKP